jgi:hypothetical protein
MKPKVIIIIEGGWVQNILSNTEVDTFLIDYDTQGVEEEVLTDIPYKDGNGTGDRGSCVIYPPEIDIEEVERLHKIIVNSYKNED